MKLNHLLLLQVVPNLPFMPASEVKVLNHLCRLGTYYKDFRDFIQHYGFGILSQQTPGKNFFLCSFTGASMAWLSLSRKDFLLNQGKLFPTSYFSFGLEECSIVYI